jgi:hypothetical protein
MLTIADSINIFSEVFDFPSKNPNKWDLKTTNGAMN